MRGNTYGGTASPNSPKASSSVSKPSNRLTQSSRTVLLLLVVLLLPTAFARGQGTAFTYQGRLNDGTNPASGIYDINFTLYDAPANGNVIGGTVSKAATDVNNGYFNVTVDFGASIFNGNALWLQLSVRTNGSGSPQFTTISPRQPITAAPYAITAGNVSGTNVARLNVPNTAVQATGHPVVSGGAITSVVVDSGGSGYTGPVPVTISANGPGSGAKLSAVISGGSVAAINVTQPGSGYTASATLNIGAPPPNTYQVFGSSNYFPGVNLLTNPANVFVGSSFAGDGAGLSGLWRVGGNAGTTAGPNFVGTTDNQPLEFKANNQRVLRIEPTSIGAPNVIGGSSINFVEPNRVGAVIAGGGATNFEFAAHSNSVAADFGTIGGGLHNSIEADATFSTIGGGAYNTIRSAAMESSIAGGYGNYIDTGAFASHIGGGVANQIWSDTASSSIVGGYNNKIQDGSASSSIGGGVDNTIQFDTRGSVIAGGNSNLIQIGAYGSTIGGGSNNAVQFMAYGGTVGGGSNNTVRASASDATIAGGRNNTIQTNACGSTIAGGTNNTIQLGAYGGTISGGFSNTVAGPRATIPGGDGNVAAAYSLAAGHNAQALHDGCFVWSDSTSTNAKSTGTNQFVIGASGGVILQGTNTGLKVEGPASFPGGVQGWVGFNGGLTAYNGLTYLSGGAYIYNGAQINGGTTLNNGASVYGYTTLNGGATIYNGALVYSGATVYGYAYLENGASVYNGLELFNTFSSGWQLYLHSQYAGKPGGGSWGDNSDARLKKNIKPITGALDKLTQLRGVTFEWINPADHGDMTNTQSGFIAQEVERVFPEWVTKMGAHEHDKALTDDGKVRTLSLPMGYDALVVESLKELRAENVELRERVEKLEKLLNSPATPNSPPQ